MALGDLAKISLGKNRIHLIDLAVWLNRKKYLQFIYL